MTKQELITKRFALKAALGELKELARDNQYAAYYLEIAIANIGHSIRAIERELASQYESVVNYGTSEQPDFKPLPTLYDTRDEARTALEEELNKVHPDQWIRMIDEYEFKTTGAEKPPQYLAGHIRKRKE